MYRHTVTLSSTTVAGLTMQWQWSYLMLTETSLRMAWQT